MTGEEIPYATAVDRGYLQRKKKGGRLISIEAHHSSGAKFPERQSSSVKNGAKLKQIGTRSRETDRTAARHQGIFEVICQNSEKLAQGYQGHKEIRLLAYTNIHKYILLAADKRKTGADI